MLDWFRKRREKQFEEYIAEREAKAKKEAEAKLLEQQRLEEAAAKLIKEAEQKKKNSDEPYIIIESADIDSNGNIRMKLDWNEAFIKYLRDQCNFEGDDDFIVQRWIGALYREIYDDGKNDALNILDQIGTELTPETVSRISKELMQEGMEEK